MGNQTAAYYRNAPNTHLNTPDGSILPHLSLYFIQIIALVLPAFPGRRSIFCIIIIALAIRAQLAPHFTNNIGLAQPFTIGWSFYLATLAKIAFSGKEGPEAHFWRDDREKKEAMSFRSVGFAKLRWALALLINQRGIKWNFKVKNVPATNSRHKATFLARQAYQYIKCMIIADLLGQMSIRLFYTSPDGGVGALNSKYLTLRHSNLFWSFLKRLVFATTPYFMLNMQYAQFAFVAVLIGLAKPEDWPPPFGCLRETTTLRHFWGKYWHQQLRHMLTSYTDSVINTLNIPRKTNWSSYTTLYLAFLISGTFHALSQMTLPCPSDIAFAERTHGFFLFFVWQMAAITVEDFVLWLEFLINQNQITSGCRFWRRICGYIWITASMWMSIPLVGDTFLRMRLGEQALIPFSVTQTLVERFVPIPPQ